MVDRWPITIYLKIIKDFTAEDSIFTLSSEESFK